MKLKPLLFLVLLAILGVIVFAWLNPGSFRDANDRETQAAAMEREIRNIQNAYNVDYAEALAIFQRRHRQR